MIENKLNTAIILGIPLFSNSKPALLNTLSQILAEKRSSRLKLVFTPNPEIMMASLEDSVFKNALLNADYNIPDGTGVVWASRLLALLGKSAEVKERITGVDLMLDLITLAGNNGWRVFLLGGRSGVAQEAAGKLKARFPKLIIHAASGPAKVELASEVESEKLIGEINAFRTDLLFVGFGQGKQEKWLTKHQDGLKARLAMGVGGSLDIFAGRLVRSPKVLQNLGLEWLFRLILEPSRLGRIANATIRFPVEVVKGLFKAA